MIARAEQQDGGMRALQRNVLRLILDQVDTEDLDTASPLFGDIAASLRHHVAQSRDETALPHTDDVLLRALTHAQASIRTEVRRRPLHGW